MQPASESACSSRKYRLDRGGAHSSCANFCSAMDAAQLDRVVDSALNKSHKIVANRAVARHAITVWQRTYSIR